MYMYMCMHMHMHMCAAGCSSRPIRSRQAATYHVLTVCFAMYLEQAYQVALSSVPKRDEALRKLFPRVQPSERHEVPSKVVLRTW